MPKNTCEQCGVSQLISGLTVFASGGGDVRPGLLCKEKEKGFFKRSDFYGSSTKHIEPDDADGLRPNQAGSPFTRWSPAPRPPRRNRPRP